MLDEQLLKCQSKVDQYRLNSSKCRLNVSEIVYMSTKYDEIAVKCGSSVDAMSTLGRHQELRLKEGLQEFNLLFMALSSCVT